MLRAFERTIGFAEGVVMAFDPDVLLPTAFAATVERGFDDALVACRNEQLDHDFLKFRDLATGPVRVGAASPDSDPRARTSRRWLEILDARGYGHELRAALVDACGQCWGALNFMRDPGHPFTDRDMHVVQARIGPGAAAIARSMVSAGMAETNGLEPGSVWLDENGSVVFASPAARQWLELLDARSHAGFARALLVGLAMRAARGAAHDGSGGPGRDAPEASGAIAGHIVSGTGYILANRGRAEAAFVLVHIPPAGARARYTRPPANPPDTT
jgi:hypothetical protein